MRIERIGVMPYCLPLRSPFVTAHGTMRMREGIILEIITANGMSGIGEIAPLPGLSRETLAEALIALQRCDFVGMNLDEALENLYGGQKLLPASVICGLEIALLDLLQQHLLTDQALRTAKLGAGQDPQVTGRSLGERSFPVQQKRTSIPVNTVIGLSSLEMVVERAKEAVADGFWCLKIKMGMAGEAELERLRAIREAVGPNIQLRLDANEAWNFEQASAFLTRCESLNIQYVEQPLLASDLVGMQNLRQAVAIPIAADEAIYDLTSARRVLAAQAADILILKPQIIGGLHVSRQIIAEACEYGVQCVITSALETGIGIAALLHLVAASSEVKLPCGLSTLSLLEDDLIIEHLSVQDGSLLIPSGEGLGIHLDRQALEKYPYIPIYSP